LRFGQTRDLVGRQISGQPEAAIVARDIRSHATAARGAQLRRGGVPGAPAHAPGFAPRLHLRAASRRQGLLTTIFDLLPDIAGHAVETESIGSIVTDHRRVRTAVITMHEPQIRLARAHRGVDLLAEYRVRAQQARIARVRVPTRALFIAAPEVRRRRAG